MFAVQAVIDDEAEKVAEGAETEMTNADKFKHLFGIYATELWSMPEKDFLEWINSEVMNSSEIPNKSDTISRQAAIHIASGYCHPANIAAELSKLPPEQTEQQWIPVSERLPEDSEDVLVWFEYFRYGDYNRMYSTYGIGNYESRFDSWFVNHESGWTNLHVFAWMPMPEPYKPQERGASE